MKEADRAVLDDSVLRIQRGWKRHGFGGDRGPNCAVGAIWGADRATGRPSHFRRVRIYRALNRRADSSIFGKLAPLWRLWSWIAPAGALVCWNDSWRTYQSNVHQLFREVADPCWEQRERRERFDAERERIYDLIDAGRLEVEAAIERNHYEIKAAAFLDDLIDWDAELVKLTPEVADR